MGILLEPALVLKCIKVLITVCSKTRKHKKINLKFYFDGKKKVYYRIHHYLFLEHYKEFFYLL